jgi:hypothetical protein
LGHFIDVNSQEEYKTNNLRKRKVNSIPTVTMILNVTQKDRDMREHIWELSEILGVNDRESFFLVWSLFLPMLMLIIFLMLDQSLPTVMLLVGPIAD